MPDLKTYNLFISHAWRYDDDYQRLVRMLRDAPNFNMHNFSVPQHDPVIVPGSNVGRQRLIFELDQQIKPVHCVLVLGGMYAAYSDWIQKEIEIAQSYRKPIIGIYPWGQFNMPRVVQDASVDIVGWNTNSIVSSIRYHSS